MTPRATISSTTTTTSPTTAAYSSSRFVVNATSSSLSSATTTTTTHSLPTTTSDRSFLPSGLQLQDECCSSSMMGTGSRCSSPMPGKRPASLISSSSTSSSVVAVASLAPIQTRQQLKKRRRIGGVVCRTHSPVASPHNSPKTFKAVKRIPPTLPGVQKAAQVLQEDHGIVVFPTERTYEACVQWSENKPQEWERTISPFFSVAFRANHPSGLPATSTPPSYYYYHLYVPKHKLCHLDRLLGFPKKAYALKPTPTPITLPSAPLLSPTTTTTLSPTVHTTTTPSSSTTTTPCKVYCFSETRWILHRLARRFWPGPVNIFVPVVGSSSSSSSSDTTKRFATELLQPLPCLTTTPGRDNVSQAFTSSTLNISGTTKDDQHKATSEACKEADAVDRILFVGLRCPSHPLTARILREASTYQSKKPTTPSLYNNTTTSAHNSNHRTISTNGTQHNEPPKNLSTKNHNNVDQNNCWWLGLPVQGTEPSLYLTTAQDVAQNITSKTSTLTSGLSPSSSALSACTVGCINTTKDLLLPTPSSAVASSAINAAAASPPTALTVHVVNGEDKRELFAVPTCQQHASTISLWIDDTTRTIHVFGTCGESSSSTSTIVLSIRQILERCFDDVSDDKGGGGSSSSSSIGTSPSTKGSNTSGWLSSSTMNRGSSTDTTGKDNHVLMDSPILCSQRPVIVPTANSPSTVTHNDYDPRHLTTEGNHNNNHGGRQRVLRAVLRKWNVVHHTL